MLVKHDQSLNCYKAHVGLKFDCSKTGLLPSDWSDIYPPDLFQNCHFKINCWTENTLCDQLKNGFYSTRTCMLDVTTFKLFIIYFLLVALNCMYLCIDFSFKDIVLYIQLYIDLCLHFHQGCIQFHSDSCIHFIPVFHSTSISSLTCIIFLKIYSFQVSFIFYTFLHNSELLLKENMIYIWSWHHISFKCHMRMTFETDMMSCDPDLLVSWCMAH